LAVIAEVGKALVAPVTDHPRLAELGPDLRAKGLGEPKFVPHGWDEHGPSKQQSS
jgi:hypothetical protein